MATSKVTLGIGRIYGIVKDGRFVDIIGPIKGDGRSSFDHDIIVDITWRPDVKVGDTWPICNLEELAKRQAARPPKEN